MAHKIPRIQNIAELVELATDLGVRRDWHEPDEQGLTAHLYGQHFDNAGFWGEEVRSTVDGTDITEQYVELRKDGAPVAHVNLATLFAFATGYEGF